MTGHKRAASKPRRGWLACLPRHACMVWLLASACQALPGHAGSFHKCTVGGKISFQDTPCRADLETVAQGLERKANLAELERKLDELQAEGVGMVQRDPAANAESAAILSSSPDSVKQLCEDKLVDFPALGMTDEMFRNCTVHARMGGVTQIVVSEDGLVPLRLYIFPTKRASRVYAIDGLITTIKP